MTKLKLKLPWIYLAHGYINNAHQSIKYAHENALRFRRLGFLTFSPIENSHYPDQIIQKKRNDIYNSVVGTWHNPHNYELADQDKLYPNIDWVDMNLNLLKVFTSRQYLEGFERNIVIALDPTVFKMPIHIRDVLFNKQHPSEYYEAMIEEKITQAEFKNLWQSDGCYQEYLFALGANILIIDAPRFLHLVEKYPKFNQSKSPFKWHVIWEVIRHYPEVKLF